MALALSSCGTSDHGAPVAQKSTPTITAAPPLAPALSPAQARDAIANYSKVNNTANATQDLNLLGSVEGGPREAMSKADHKGQAALPIGERRAYIPWSYRLSETDLFIPRLGSGKPRWFAAITRGGNQQQYARVLVMAENTTTKQWEMVSTVDLADPHQLPTIVRDKDGYATAVDATSKSLATPVDQLRAAVVDNFVTGGLSGQKVLAPTASSQQQIKIHNEAARKFGTRGTTKFSAVPPEFTGSYALKTTTGTFVVFAHTHAQNDAVTAPGYRIVPEMQDRAWLGTTPAPGFNYRFTCSDAAAVPTGSGSSSLLGYGCRRTDAKPVGPSESV
ncbi:hypothetical protein ACIO3O_08335 [Streptomyces sp. NPDC087440]|uniref:hypothetical protein n=1 Tax=Streptomyces sp. NPDC087440 TaxID=3365790 RepID=UPI0037FDE4CB